MRESTLGGTMGDNVYGVASPTHKTKCRHSNNPNGHNPACPCGWFAPHVTAAPIAATVRYPMPKLPPSDHDHWWPAENDYEGDQMREERAFNE